MLLSRNFLSKQYYWVYFISLISLLLLVAELINGRLWMHDLEVYYKTAARLVEGKELYRIKVDGHYVYKYSPTAAIYFIPLLLLPFSLAKILYWLFLTAFAAVALGEFYKLITATEKPKIKVRQRNLVLILSFLAVGAHFHREWHLGQVNLLLLGIYIFQLKSVHQNKSLLAGLLLALSLFIKPFGLIFLLYLLLKQKIKTIIYALVFSLILGLLPFMFYPSATAFQHLYASWWQELVIELSAKQNLLAPGNHTIFSVIARFTPIQYLLADAIKIKIYQFVLLFIIGGFILFLMWLGRRLPQSVFAEMAVLIALIPLFSFTSYNAFLFTAPVILLLIYNYQVFGLAGKIGVVVSCLLVGANIRDLVGKALFNFFEANSVYTFGALLLISLIFILRKKQVV